MKVIKRVNPEFSLQKMICFFNFIYIRDDGCLLNVVVIIS